MPPCFYTYTKKSNSQQAHTAVQDRTHIEDVSCQTGIQIIIPKRATSPRCRATRSNGPARSRTAMGNWREPLWLGVQPALRVKYPCLDGCRCLPLRCSLAAWQPHSCSSFLPASRQFRMASQCQIMLPMSFCQRIRHYPNLQRPTDPLLHPFR